MIRSIRLISRGWLAQAFRIGGRKFQPAILSSNPNCKHQKFKEEIRIGVDLGIPADNSRPCSSNLWGYDCKRDRKLLNGRLGAIDALRRYASGLSRPECESQSVKRPIFI